MRSFRLSLVVACAVTVGVTLPAVAQTYYGRDGYAYGPGIEYAPRPYAPPSRVAPPPGYYDNRSVQQVYQGEYHQSGTLGRQGLGADPRHPEGPGNQSLGGSR